MLPVVLEHFVDLKYRFRQIKWLQSSRLIISLLPISDLPYWWPNLHLLGLPRIVLTVLHRHQSTTGLPPIEILHKECFSVYPSEHFYLQCKRNNMKRIVESHKNH